MPRVANLYLWRDRRTNGERGGHLALAMPYDRTGSILSGTFGNYISWWPADVDDPDAAKVDGKRRGKAHTKLLDGRRETGRAHAGLMHGELEDRGVRLGEGVDVFRPRTPMQSTLENSLLFEAMDPAERINALTAHERRPSVTNLCDVLPRALPDNAPGWDQIYYVTDPDDTLEIPLHTAVSPGLNELAVNTWFEGFLREYHGQWRGTYKFVSKTRNCASVVLRAMKAGNATFFAEPPRAWFWRSPAGVYAYAENLVQGIQRMTVNRDAYEAAKHQWQGEHRQELYAHPPGADVELPSVAQWKADSRVAGGFSTGFARRKEQVANIDRLLQQYHAMPGWGAEAADDQRVRQLGLIFDECGSYMREKQGNRRFDAVLRLAQRILQVVSVRNVPGF